MNNNIPITEVPTQPEASSDSRLPILIALTVAIPLFIVTVGLCIVGVRRACKRFQRRLLISQEENAATILRVTQTVSPPPHYIPDTTFKHSTTPVDCAFPTWINMEDPIERLRAIVEDMAQKIEGLNRYSDIDAICRYANLLRQPFNPVESILQNNYNVLYNCYHVKLNKILRKIQQGHLPHKKTADHQDTPHPEHDYRKFYAYADNPSDPGISDLIPPIPDSALLGRYRVERPSPDITPDSSPIPDYIPAITKTAFRPNKEKKEHMTLNRDERAYRTRLTDETPAHRIPNPYTSAPTTSEFFDPPEEYAPREGSSSFSDHSSDTSLGF